MPNTGPDEQERAAARKRLIKRGISITEWAKEHKVNRSTVSAVLSGQNKCLRGKSHKIAVLLGLKPTPENDTAGTQG